MTGSATTRTDIQDVAPPAANRATITLADGTKIFLDSTGNGVLARQNNVALKKTGEGEIVYDKSAANSGTEMIFNTLANPKGSRAISMTLSDGSQLWLNAGSSVTFPVAFNGPERKISITGEAYFEVARDPSKKFIVIANSVATEVLGTHFNVNAYGDRDAVKVTLLEGRVKVIASDGSSSMIKPGGQVVETMDGKLITNLRVDVEEAIAWKNEMFNFNNTEFKDIMKEVSRWYDVDIEYKGDFGELGFGGNMSRQKNVSELLKRLEATQAVKFEVNGRKITVLEVK
jgi:ferric-dicitrate binding protein FerR (iron transport regulator)